MTRYAGKDKKITKLRGADPKIFFPMFTQQVLRGLILKEIL